jgi:hypothetical protein
MRNANGRALSGGEPVCVRDVQVIATFAGVEFPAVEAVYRLADKRRRRGIAERVKVICERAQSVRASNRGVDLQRAHCSADCAVSEINMGDERLIG